MLLDKAQESGLITGLTPDLVDGGICMLQYVDGTIFLFQDDLEGARNLKFILSLCADFWVKGKFS